MNEMTPKARARVVKERHERDLLALEGVEAVGLGRLHGEPAIRIYVDHGAESAIANIPPSLDGIPVVIKESGVFQAL
ncbi:hypothetical protein JHN59_10600 [Streptomyces sp. MBT49]|uniref:hypothetical protein n=1 Tax=Streptomyces sp. MBT49 TaxID=1488380 RepID=UPI00190A51BA|nr:hypothetical protein [Streptomyces sp. MBT49]MBK3625288.1 hypothetical protein [Streptomyces sp. MBT49]